MQTPDAVANSDFRRYVLSISSEITPPTEDFGEVLERLRSLLVFELRRRGLWSMPPRYLGIIGGKNWAERAVLDELLFDCYAYVFIDRLRGLRRQAAVRRSIDGLVTLSVRHFVHDAQRRHDPFGYRIFELVHAATESLVERGVLHVLSGDDQIRNATVLGFSPGGSPGMAVMIEPRVIEAWNDRLMPDLATTWHRGKVVETLAGFIVSLKGQGVAMFRFRDLLHPLKEDARARLQALLGVGTETAVDDGVPERRDFEEREGFRDLMRCLERAIESQEKSHEERVKLRRLLEILVQRSAALEAGALPPLPSERRLADLLELPRPHIRRLRSTLESLARDCARAAPDAAGASLPSSRETEFPAEERAMAREDQTERLRELTRRALAGASAEARPGTEPPLAVGDVMIFPDNPLAVEWLWLAGETDRVELVPVDQAPFAGSTDVEIEAEGGERVVVRPALSTRTTAFALAGAVRSFALSARDLARVRERRTSLHSSGFEASEVTGPEERAWRRTLEAACRRLEGESERAGSPADSPSSMLVRRHRPTPWRIRALAAALAAFCLGLGLWVRQLDRALDEARSPALEAGDQIAEVRLGSRDRGGEVRLETRSDRVSIDLVLRDLPEHPLYQLRLAREGARAEPWLSAPFSRREQHLSLPSGLGVERWSLEILGLDAAGVATLLDERTLVITRLPNSR